jgi:hypothetical protein
LIGLSYLTIKKKNWIAQQRCGPGRKMLFSKNMKSQLELSCGSNWEQWGSCYPCQQMTLRGCRHPAVSNLREHSSPAFEGPTAGFSAAVNWSKSVRGYNEGSIKGEMERGLLMEMSNLTTKKNCVD